jgi:beta-phosphoglucomutase
MISALVFDFDGVLADSEPLHLAATQDVLASIGAALPREEYYADYLGYDDAGMFRALSDARGWGLTSGQIATLIAEKATALEAIISGTDVLYPSTPDCVRQLAADWPLGIASGAFRHEIEAILRRGGIDRYFKFIVGAGDTPESKPQPGPYRRAAQLHGADPGSCLAIEDSRFGIESAKSAGLWCVGITSTYPVSELMAADAIIASLDELTPELIRSFGTG